MREITVVVSSKGKARDAAALALPAPAAAFEGLLPQGDVLACGRDFLVRRGADGRVAGLFWDAQGDVHGAVRGSVFRHPALAP